ncbi:hypothetical protein LCGC14_0450900 [marine sediment metagenome]|uniref:Terminase large subunit gp17-like C-terminal domain-containing protein n=1 Tax=marine sediment metagenome TaxID=412755 RepID=A0A0F9SN66_9ZZZZ
MGTQLSEFLSPTKLRHLPTNIQIVDRSIRMEMLDWQGEVLNDPAREKTVSGGRGIWKTDFGMKWLTLETLESQFRDVAVFTSPSYKQAKRNIWDKWNKFLEDQPVKIKVGENSQDLVIRLIDGKSIILVGMDNFDALRGIHPLGACNDEKAYSPILGFNEVLDLALANKKGKVLNLSTPKGRQHYYRTFMKGWGKSALKGHKSWIFGQPDVMTIPYEELLRYMPGMGGDKEMTPDYYAQEWLGQFLGYEGLVFPEFVARPWPEGHLLSVQDWNAIRDQCYIFGACDWGFADETVFLWCARTPDGRIIIFKEFTVKNRTPTQVVQLIKGKHPLPDITYLDPHAWDRERDGKSVADEFNNAGLRCEKADNRFQASIQHIRIMQTQANPSDYYMFMIVEGQATKLSQNLSSLEDRDLEPAGGGFKRHADCHAADAARYGAMTLWATPIVITTEQLVERGPIYIPSQNSMDPNTNSEVEEQIEFHPISGRPLN